MCSFFLRGTHFQCAIHHLCALHALVSNVPYVPLCLLYSSLTCRVRYLYTFMVFLTLNKTAEKAFNFYFVWYISDYIIFCDDNKSSLMQYSTQRRQWGKWENFSWRKERSIIGKILEIKKQFSYLQGKIFFSILVNLFLER